MRLPKTYHVFEFAFEQYRDGKLIYAELVPNIVTDEGEDWILDVAFRNNQLSGFVDFEVVIATDASLTETSVFASVTELADGDGYADINVARATSGWSAPTGTTPSSITTPSSGNHSWTATADWNSAAAVEYICLVTNGLTPERLIALAALGGGSGRIVLNGDVLNVTLDAQLGGS